MRKVDRSALATPVSKKAIETQSIWQSSTTYKKPLEVKFESLEKKKTVVGKKKKH